MCHNSLGYTMMCGINVRDLIKRFYIIQWEILIIKDVDFQHHNIENKQIKLFGIEHFNRFNSIITECAVKFLFEHLIHSDKFIYQS